MRLQIHTLGDFDISFKEQSAIKQFGRSYKLFKLFEYFVTFRGRKLLPETIIENLWQNNEYNDPKNVLRTQIFRLRQIYKAIFPQDVEESKYFTISFTNGYYCFQLGEYANLDIEEFESYIEQGDNHRTNDINESVKFYKKALKLYKGPYLAENSCITWLVPIRNYYSRLYLRTLFKLIEILKEKEEYSSIMKLCEEAILIEPYEEAIHIYLIESLLKMGYIKDAMSHYEYIASLLNKEVGIRASIGLKNIYKKIQSYCDEKGKANLESIKTELEESRLKGALLCDSDYFKFLFNVQKRKGLREVTFDFMSLVTLKCEGEEKQSKDEIKEFVKIMSIVLEKSLRKGDVYSFWNDTQILIMLHGAKENYLDEIEKRIRKNFCDAVKTDNCKIGISFLPLVSENCKE